MISLWCWCNKVWPMSNETIKKPFSWCYQLFIKICSMCTVDTFTVNKKVIYFVAIQTWEKEGSLLPFKHEKRKALCCHSNMRKGRLFGTVHTFSSFSCLICCFVLSLYYCQFLYPNHIFWIVLLSSVYNFASRRHMLNLCNCV
jgi:hypothetical protein